MGDKINRFLQGKKKYSVYIATLLTSIITMAVPDPGAQAELQELVPLAAMVLSGIAYLIVEGWNDTRRAEAEEAYYNMLAATRQTHLPATPAQESVTTQAPSGPPPFNEAEFIRDFHARVVETAGKLFTDSPASPPNLYRAAEHLGQRTECHDIREAVAYWEYLAQLAEDAWRQLEFDTRDEKGCKLFSPDLYEFRATSKRTAALLDKLQKMDRTADEWRKRGGPPWGVTLYSVGSMAA